MSSNIEEIQALLEDIDECPDPTAHAKDAGPTAIEETPAQAVTAWLDRQILLGMVSQREIEAFERLIGDIE